MLCVTQWYYTTTTPTPNGQKDAIVFVCFSNNMTIITVKYF